MQSSPCDSIQQEISAALDEGGGFSESTIDHLKSCAECSGFLDFCVRDGCHLLDSQLPPAGQALHAVVRGLAAAGQRPPAVALPRRGWVRRGVSITSAAAVVMLCAAWLVEVKPAADDHDSAQANVTAKQELVALQSDFHQGATGLHHPLQTLRTVFNR